MQGKRHNLYKLRYVQVPGIVLAAILFIIVAIFSVINNNINTQLKEWKALVDEGSYLVTLKQKEVVELADQLVLASTDEFIASEARTQYGYLAPGEIRFVVTNPEVLWGKEGAPADMRLRP
ncbi:MAG: hypothetical protein GX781_08705 [Clostridiales bacterium]|nr:hypothetical protein [Clostridiales bacterium]